MQEQVLKTEIPPPTNEQSGDGGRGLRSRFDASGRYATLDSGTVFN